MTDDDGGEDLISRPLPGANPISSVSVDAIAAILSAGLYGVCCSDHLVSATLSNAMRSARLTRALRRVCPDR